MKAHSIKTDNANISKKVYLRKKATEHLERLRVLDLFAGKNQIWHSFDCERYYGVEFIKGKGANLNGDNRKVIPALDLSNFNVIDFDSYGIPFQQIEQLFKNPTLQKGTVILYTCIGNGMSTLAKTALKEFGLANMYKKQKTLFNKKSVELFHAYLYKKGVSKVFEYEEKSPTFRKHYGYFIV